MYEQDSFEPIARLVWLKEELTESANDEPSHYEHLFEDSKSKSSIQVFHYHNDHLGTPNELTNQQGEVVWLADYEAWGNTAKVVWHEQAIEQLHIEKDYLQPIRFQGQYVDAETSLHYNRFRYYDADVGMFISRDPISLMGGSNVFQYAPNPTGWIDPWGLNRSNKSTECCRKPWQVNKYDEICIGRLNGKQVTYYRDPSTQLWWSKDTEGHGGSVWKVMKKEGTKLIHKFDADVYGDYMPGKHKGDTGKIMDMKKMKCKKINHK